MDALFRLSVSRRLVVMVAFAVAAMAILVGILMTSERAMLLRERQDSVRQAVETAHGILVHFHGLAAKGDMSEEEAKKRAMEAIRPLRYSGAEYFWINDMQPRMVMHPIRPELQGQDLSANKDPTGKHLFVEFVNTVKKDGAGYVDYMWPKPGSDAPVEKASYVKGFAPWGWIVGSGVYVDTVQATFIRRLAEAGGEALVLALLLVFVGWLISRSILQQLGGEPALLNHITHQIAQGDLTVDIPTSASGNSVLHGIQAMRDSLAGVVLRVRQGSEHVSTASAEIAQGNHDLSARTESQASALEETAASMEELGSTVRQNADNARQANQLAVSASTVAVQGGDVVAEVVTNFPYRNSRERDCVQVTVQQDFCFLGSRPLFAQVLTNLIKNALHALASASTAPSAPKRVWRMAKRGSCTAVSPDVAWATACGSRSSASRRPAADRRERMRREWPPRP